jgi:hypothetical protein
VTRFKYFGRSATNQNLIPGEIKSRLNCGNAAYHSVQNLLSSRLLPKNVKIRIYKIVILPLDHYGCKISSLTLTEEHRLKLISFGTLYHVAVVRTDVSEEHIASIFRVTRLLNLLSS